MEGAEMRADMEAPMAPLIQAEQVLIETRLQVSAAPKSSNSCGNSHDRQGADVHSGAQGPASVVIQV